MRPGAWLLLGAAAGASACSTIFGDFTIAGTGTAGTGGGTTVSSASSSGSSMGCSPGAMQACYDGPAGTENVGACKPGTATCAADGESWGTCMGEVVPQPKTCASTADVACDGLPCVVWANAYGDTTNSQGITAVALDPSDGSLVVAGTYAGSIQFGSTTLMPMPPDSTATFVARISAAGTPVWAQPFPHGSANSLAVDSGGSVYAGMGSGAATTIAGTAIHEGQYVMKLDGASGTPMWANFLGGAAAGPVVGPGPGWLRIAADGDVLVLGSFQTPIDFGDGAIQPATGSAAGYLAKLDSTNGMGTMANTGTRWAQIFSAPQLYPGGLGIDGMGNVYLGLSFNGTLALPHSATYASTSINGTDLGVFIFGQTGAQSTLALHAGNAGSQTVNDMAVDSFGNVTLAGQMQGTLTFMTASSSATLSATSSAGDGFLLQLNQALLYTWGRAFGTQGAALNVGVDAQGDVRTFGWFTGTFDLGAGMLDAAANQMMLLADLSGTDGSVQWNRGWIYPQSVTASLAVAPAGDSFVGGTLASGPFNLGTGPLIQAADPGEAWAGRFAP
jgi:hypothetical protein